MTGVEPGTVTSRSLLRGNSLDGAIKRAKLRGKPVAFGAEGPVPTEVIKRGLAAGTEAAHRDVDDWGHWRPDSSSAEIRRILTQDPTVRGEIQAFVINVRNGCAIEGLPEPLTHDEPMKRIELRSGRSVNLPDARLAILQQLVARKLRPIIEAKLPPTTFAYRPKRSTHAALYTARRLVSKDGFVHAVCADIRKCFPHITIDHIDKALVALCPELHASMRNVVRFCIDVDVLVPVLDDRGKVLRYERQPSPAHVLQGAPLAPMLANLVLAHVADYPFVQAGRTDVVLLRWADDLLILGQTPEGAVRALSELEIQLNAAGFSLKEEKCIREPIDLTKGSIGWLGHEVSAVEVRLPREKLQVKLDRVLEAPSLRDAHGALCGALAHMTLEPAEVVQAFVDEVRERRPNVWRTSKKRIRKNRAKRRDRLVRYFRCYQQVRKAIGASGPAGIGTEREEGQR